MSWTPELEAEIRRLAESGVPHTVISARTGRSRKAISKKLKRMGIVATMCRNGHPKTAESTYSDGRCRICARALQAQWRLRLDADQREARNARKRLSRAGAAHAPSRHPAWETPENLALILSLRTQGVSGKVISERIGNGCTSKGITRVARREGWPAYKVLQCTRAKPSWMTDEALERGRKLWDAKVFVPDIAKELGCTPGAIRGVALRHHWPHRSRVAKPPPAKIAKSHQRKIKYAASVKKQRVSAAGIPIPLRRIYELSARFDLPRTKRGDIHALNAAVKRAQPDHPGFVLSDYQPTRLMWAR